MKVWQLQEAKAKFSQLVKEAETSGPQSITVHGEPAVVLVSHKDFGRLLRKSTLSLVQFFRKSPFKGLHLEVKRDASPGRKVK